MTVENCGEDFLSRLASSNEDWDTEVDPEWGLQGEEGAGAEPLQVRRAQTNVYAVSSEPISQSCPFDLRFRPPSETVSTLQDLGNLNIERRPLLTVIVILIDSISKSALTMLPPLGRPACDLSLFWPLGKS